MGRISALTELTSLASDDYLVVLDSSASIAKKITIANAFGIPDFGWTASGESWTYNAWDSTNKIGTVTVPTDATIKYTLGMFIKITQSTGGTKYAKILSVTSTTIVAYFGSSTLNNEAITSPSYSPLATPLGLPRNVKDFIHYKFSAYHNTTQSFTGSTFVKMQFNTEDYDNGSNYSSNTFTAPITGLYHLEARTSIPGTNARGFIMIYKNGALHKRGTDASSVSANPNGPLISINVRLTAGDTIDFYCYVTTTASSEPGDDIQWCSGMYIGD